MHFKDDVIILPLHYNYFLGIFNHTIHLYIPYEFEFNLRYTSYPGSNFS